MVGHRVAPSRGLAELIRSNMERIVAAWAERARQIPGARDLSQSELVDHVPPLLQRIADMADAIASGEKIPEPTDLAAKHARERLALGFDAEEVLVEYSMLRETVIETWSREQEAVDVAGVLILAKAFDAATGASLREYVEARNRTLEAFSSIFSAGLVSRTGDELLSRLLTVFLESTPVADTAAIFLREGDRLRLRVSAGLDQEVEDGFSLRIGEGFVGQVAKDRVPAFTRNAAEDERVLSGVLREKRVRALLAVPLLDGDELLGVAHVGSLSAFDLSKQDRRLFEAMVWRATGLIRGVMLREAAERQARQQRAVADFGARTLATTDLRAVYDDAVATVRDTLETDLCDILELDARGQELLLRAGIGYAEGAVGTVRVARAAGELLGHVLGSDTTVGVEDFGRKERACELPAYLRDHGVRSALATVIRGHHGTSMPYGLLTTSTRERRVFTEDDHAFVESMAAALSGAITRKDDEWRIRENEEVHRFLSEASRQMSGSLDIEVIIDTVTRLARERFGASCSVHLGDEEQGHGEMQVDGGDLSVPIRAGSRTVGALRMGSPERERRYASLDLIVAQELANRAGLAIENARLYRTSNEAVARRHEILAVVTHDLRSPLNTVHMAAETVAEEAPELAPHAERILRAARRMDRLIRDLLDLATLEEGRLTMQLDQHEAAKIAGEATDAFRGEAEEQGVELHCDAEPALQAIRCDRDRVLQVLSNLLSNALRATPEGGSIEVHVCRDGDNHARFSVSDTGSGISADEQAHLFERYWRGRTAGYRGTGRGLAIAKGIVEAHGGRIWVESGEGAGTTFHFTLPCE